MIHTSDYLTTVTGRVYWRKTLGDHCAGEYTQPAFEAMVTILAETAAAYVQYLLPDTMTFSATRREIYYPAGVKLPNSWEFFNVAMAASTRTLLSGLDAIEAKARELMEGRHYLLALHNTTTGQPCDLAGTRVPLAYMWPALGKSVPMCPRGCPADVLLGDDLDDVAGVPDVIDTGNVSEWGPRPGPNTDVFPVKSVLDGTRLIVAPGTGAV